MGLICFLHSTGIFYEDHRDNHDKDSWLLTSVITILKKYTLILQWFPWGCMRH